MIGLRCRVCGAPIPESLAHIMRYCSDDCRRLARKIRTSTTSPLLCEWCGADLPRAARKDGRRFCGRACWSDWRKWDTDALYLKRDQHLTGEDVPTPGPVVEARVLEVVILPGGIVAERIWHGGLKTSLPGIGKGYEQRAKGPELDEDDD